MNAGNLTRGKINLLRAISLIDAGLLIPLVVAAFRHDEGVIDVLGPIHGFLFLGLIGLLFVWRDSGLWSGPFVLAVVVFGPIASIAGLERYSRRLRAAD